MYTITDAEELSNTCLKYNDERCSQKWYTSSVYVGIKDDSHENFNLACCKREALFLSKLEHINIVKFVGIYFKPKNPQPILVTEEVTSNLLYHLDKVKTLENAKKCKFSCGVSDGLAYLHSRRIAHLNLYTKSILLTDSLIVKIANFEYASYFLNDSVEVSSSSSVPQPDESFNPWDFRDDPLVYSFLPEKYFKRTYDSLDIYSFGCVVFNIFTLRQPTVQIKSQVEEISILIPGVGALINDCIQGSYKTMEDVSSVLNV